MSAIPDRVWELLTKEEQDQLRAMTNGWRHEPNVNCPACGASIGVRLKITAAPTLIDAEGQPLNKLLNATTTEVPTPRVNQQTHLAEQDLLLNAERTGLLKAFASAVREDKPTNIPGDIRKHFLTFLRTAAAKKVPTFAIEYFKDQFDGYLNFWSAQGVLAVTVDGIVRHFVPLRFVSGDSITSIGTNKMKGRLMVDDRDLDVWVKGRFGYVPLASENYLDAMRRKNIGQFGALVQ